jgi:hypothetical protein
MKNLEEESFIHDITEGEIAIQEDIDSSNREAEVDTKEEDDRMQLLYINEIFQAAL